MTGPQITIYSRPEFVRLCRIQPNTFNQRSHQGQNALAWGRRKPLHQGEYTPLDAAGMLLTSMFSFYARIDLRSAADVVAENWPAWTPAIAAAERNMEALPSDQDYFAIGVTFKNKNWSGKRDIRDFVPERVSVGFGKRQEAIKAAEKGGAHDVIFPLPMQAVVSALHGNANMAKPKIKLPDLICPAAPGTPEFDDWMAATSGHESAILKAKARKAKVNA